MDYDLMCKFNPVVISLNCHVKLYKDTPLLFTAFYNRSSKSTQY